MKKRPPAIATWILRRILPGSDTNNLLGDFSEIYANLSEESGASAARRWYWRQVFITAPAFITNSIRWSVIMLHNYIKTALRNIARQKVHAAINVFGLSLGLACTILIYMYVADELSYDRFHENGDSIYAVVCRDSFHDMTGITSTVSMGPVMEDYFPEIEETVRINNRNSATVMYNDKIFSERPVFTDPHFFDVFTFSLAAGDPAAALQPEDAVVITESTALKYFGSTNALGKPLLMIFDNFRKEFTVAAIAHDPPENSTVKFKILANLENLKYVHGPDYLSNWQWKDTDTYAILKKGASPEAVNDRFSPFVRQYFAERIRRHIESGGKGEDVYSFTLHNIRDIHLHPDPGVSGGGDVKSSLILAAIALAILAVACINFVNLSIGGASGRAVEIGLRKVLGAGKRQLVRQFWSESLVMTACSMTAGFLAAYMLLPLFNELAGKHLEMKSVLTPLHLSVFLLLILVVGIVSGSFPGIVMAGYKPAAVMKGTFRPGGRSAFMRTLIVVQFALSIFLIIVTLTMTKQINFLRNMDMGFNKEGIVVIETQESNWRAGAKTSAMVKLFRERLQGYDRIKNISGTTSSFHRVYAGSHFMIDGKERDIAFSMGGTSRKNFRQIRQPCSSTARSSANTNSMSRSVRPFEKMPGIKNC